MRSVFILSDKSSGSTILQQVLAEHPDVGTPAWTSHGHQETLFWVKAASVLGYPPLELSYSQLPIPPAQAHKELTEFLEHNLSRTGMGMDDEQQIFEAWLELCRRHEPILLEKSPHHLHDRRALELMEKFHQAQNEVDVSYIGLVRNPVATLYSMWRRWHALPEIAQLDWHRAYENLLQLQEIAGDRILILRYEDLAGSEGLRLLDRLCGFLEIDLVPAMTHKLHGGSLGRWRQDLRFGYQPSTAVLQLAHEYGYGEEDLVNPNAGRAWTIQRMLTRIRRMKRVTSQGFRKTWRGKRAGI